MFAFVTTDLIIQVWIFSENLILCLKLSACKLEYYVQFWKRALHCMAVWTEGWAYSLANRKQKENTCRTKRTS